MVRRDVAARKLARAQAWLDDASAILQRPLAEYRDSARERDLSAFYLMLAIQECVDLAAHWVADEGWGPPDDAAGTFDVLADHDVISRSLADELHGAVGLRNLIAHGYARLDHERVHGEADAGVRALRQFLEATARLLALHGS
jgi:uncharacterized protein YutE (UPF0331/DUF86 family)